MLELYTNTWNVTVRYDVFATDSNQLIATESCTFQGHVSVMKNLELKGKALEHTKVLIVATITEKDASVSSGVYGIMSLLGMLMNEVPVQVYLIAIVDMINGTVTIDGKEAAEGEKVMLAVTPAEGYRLMGGFLNTAVVEKG